MRRSRSRVYIARIDGNSTQTMTGGGGHNCGFATRRLPIAAAPTEVAAAAAVLTGAVEGQEKRSGTRGDVVHRTSGVREAIRVSGTSGRFIQACQGHRVGFSVRRVLKRSWPMNSRTANAPYVVNAKYTPGHHSSQVLYCTIKQGAHSPAPKERTRVPAQQAVTIRPE